MTLALWLLAAYFLGAIPTSYLVARWFGGVDLRASSERRLEFPVVHRGDLGGLQPPPDDPDGGHDRD